jgi:hypothetical protein
MAMRLLPLIFLGLLACNSGHDAAKPVPSALGNTAPENAAANEATGGAELAKASAAAVAAGAASDRRSDGQPGCRIERPAVWTTGSVSWLGNCRDGFADGSGVILNEVEGGEPERFYGRVERGHPSIGVLQTAGGYMAGTWAQGTRAMALADDVAQRNVLISAFQAAASAATLVSQSFAKKSDAKSSRFYAQQAKLLRHQMD